MPSFTRVEVQFLNQCYQIYAEDGYRLPKGVRRISRECQDTILASAMNKLTNVLQMEPLDKQEATLLLCAVRYVSETCQIVENGFDLIDLYNKLSLLAGSDKLLQHPQQ